MAKLFMSYARTRWGYSIVLSLVFAAIIVTAVLSYRAIDRELTAVALSRRAAVAQLAAATLSEKLERLVDVTVSLATRVRFRQLVAAGQWLEAREILRAVPRDFPFVDRLVLFDTAGTLMADIPEQLEVRGKNFAYRDWYQGVSRDWKPYVSTVYKRAAAPQVNVFAVAVPIREESGGVAGVLLLQTRLEAYFDWVSKVEVGTGGFVYVVDRKGQVAFHPKFPAQGEIVDLSAVPVVQRVLRGDRGIEIAFDPTEKEDAISAYAPVAKYDWGVIVRQPKRAAFAAKDQQIERLLTAYGLTFLFFVLGIYLASRIVIQHRQAETDRLVKAELEHRVAERSAQLRESEERHRAVVDTAVDAIIVIDERGTIQRFNPGAERMFGYPEAEVAGKNVSLLMPSPYHEQHDGYLARFLATGEKRIIGIGREVVALRKDGTEFPVYLAVAEMKLGENRLFTGIIRDITEAKRAAERQAHLVTSLEATNKELESFSYSVSHDLRSPLRAIDGFSRILGEDYAGKLDDEGRRLLGVICDNSRKMGQLIDDLLEFSRLGRQPITAREIDMTALVRGVLQELGVDGPERKPLVMLDTLPRGWGDPALIKQALTNLISNAIKFSSKRPQPRIEISGRNDGDETIYEVRDNGAGFDMQYYDKLFGVFQRLHSAEEFGGTGVGLAIVQRVVTRHGGRVWADGKEGEGAAFYFTLPRRNTDA